MIAAGVDGCPKGWICVTRSLRDGAIASGCYVDVAALLAQAPRPDLIGIDMPIGLLSKGARDADLEARRLLGRRGSSVFPAPIRPLLEARDWKHACELRERIDGKRISKQTWGIVRKVRQLDDALRANLGGARAIVREVHPEVSFQTWAGGPLLHAKKRSAGRRERERLVASHFGEGAYPSVREQFLRKEVANDDILDAFAALWTAERIVGGTSVTLPRVPLRDEFGLPMEIVY